MEKTNNEKRNEVFDQLMSEVKALVATAPIGQQEKCYLCVVPEGRHKLVKVMADCVIEVDVHKYNNGAADCIGVHTNVVKYRSRAVAKGGEHQIFTL